MRAMADRGSGLHEQRLGFLSAFRRLDDITFWGYAVEQNRPLMRFAIDILLDGEPIALIRAERFDGALRERGFGDGCYSFLFVAKSDQLSGCRLLEARLANSGVAVGRPI